MGEDIVIFYNDSIDSDNVAAAMVLASDVAKRPRTRVLWILEPRQVSFGLVMTNEQTNRCKDLIKKHFPERGNPFKVLLGGLLDEADVSSIPELDESERKLLNLAVKPPYGPKGDAELHGRLAAWDLAACLHQWTGAPVEVLTDLETLNEIDNPVNLNFHHHEELSSRSEGELVSYEAIMEVEPLEQRVESIRDWYRGCIKQAEENPGNKGISVRALNLSSLCDTIRRAASVQFFGGSSLRILREFIQRGVADRVQCSLQVGSCDLSANLFPNQFNVGLNQRAAKFVLDRFREFSSFTVVPSHSAQDIKYSLLGLKQAGGRCLEKRILGFNCHADPVKIATRQVTLDDDYPSKACPMPDLTAFLCALIPGYMGSKRGFVQVNDRDGVLLFKPASEGIPMYDLVNGRSLEESDVGEVLASLAGGGGG